MERRCENCGQLALANDAVCWHCGWRLVPEEQEQQLEKVTVRQGWQQTDNLSAIGLYGGLTVMVIVLALLVMGWLGAQPLVRGSQERLLEEGWQVVTAADRSFTLDLPSDWNWVDGTKRQQQEDLVKLLAEDELFRIGTYPLGEEVTDIDILLVGTSPPSDDEIAFAFVVVGRSSSLNLLAEEDAVRFLQEGEFERSLVLQVEIVDNFDRGHISIIVKGMNAAGAVLLRCQQQLVRGEHDSLLLAACAANERYPFFQPTIAGISDSFQRLSD